MFRKRKGTTPRFFYRGTEVIILTNFPHPNNHMLFYLLFLFYFLLACLLISRWGFMKRSGLAATTLLLLFMIKIAAGLFLGWYSDTYQHDTTDYFANNNGGWVEYQIMRLHPKEFFLDFLQPRYAGFGNFFGSVNSYWNDLETNIILKFLAFFNIFSRGNYYINSIFFNCFAFFGHVAFYRLFASVYTRHKIALILGCFLLPSTLYFTSGINKDNIVFALLGILIYLVHSGLQSGFTAKKVFILFTCFCGILLIRNYVALLLIPGIAAWVICKKTDSRVWVTYFSVYGFFVVAVWLLSLAFSSINPARIIYEKQRDFLLLPVANTQLQTDTLQPTGISLIRHLPQAADHALLRPYLWKQQPVFIKALAIEWSGYLILVLIFLFTARKATNKIDPVMLFGLMYAISIIILIGYIVPTMGAIVRYRSIYLPLLITPLLGALIQRFSKPIKI